MSDLSGDWVFDIDFVRGHARHSVALKQKGEQLQGTYRSQFATQEIKGWVRDGRLELGTRIQYQHNGTGYGFSGCVEGDVLRGELALGEYGKARWKAARVHAERTRPACATAAHDDSV